MRHLVLSLSLLVGCADSNSVSTASSGPDCVAGADGYDTNTPTDSLGRFLASVPHGDVTTFKVCDGPVKRVVEVYGAQVGNVEDNQAMFLTDGNRNILTAGNVITLSQQPTALSGLDITGRCLVMWDGGCDQAPVSAPEAEPAEESLTSDETSEVETAQAMEPAPVACCGGQARRARADRSGRRARRADGPRHARRTAAGPAHVDW